MKLLVHCSLFIVLLLLTTNYQPPTTYAQNTCSYAQNCSFEGQDPSLGQQSCTGTLQNNICKYDPSTEPNCSVCQLINPVTPTPTLIITPSPAKAGSEEQAVYNLNQGLLPTEVIPTPPPASSIFDIIRTFIANLFNPQRFFAQSETFNKASIPQEVHPPNDKDPLDLIKNFVGGSGGVYGVSLPQEVQSTEIKGSEGAYEKANFPEEVRPITGN